jgi:hypothetical protein
MISPDLLEGALLLKGLFKSERSLDPFDNVAFEAQSDSVTIIINKTRAQTDNDLRLQLFFNEDDHGWSAAALRACTKILSQPCQQYEPAYMWPAFLAFLGKVLKEKPHLANDPTLRIFLIDDPDPATSVLSAMERYKASSANFVEDARHVSDLVEAHPFEET